MSQEEFNEKMNNYLIMLAEQEPDEWSLEARNWAESVGLIQGGDNNKMYKKFVTREEAAQLIQRLYNMLK